MAPPYVKWNRDLKANLMSYVGVNVPQSVPGQPLRSGEQERQIPAMPLALQNETDPVPPGYAEAIEKFNETWDERAYLRDSIHYDSFYPGGQSKETAGLWIS